MAARSALWLGLHPVEPLGDRQARAGGGLAEDPDLVAEEPHVPPHQLPHHLLHQPLGQRPGRDRGLDVDHRLLLQEEARRCGRRPGRPP